MRRLYLRDDLEAALANGVSGAPATDDAIFATLFGMEGETYRRSARRRTSRVVIGGEAYFAKVHQGVGWREIAKSLLSGKRPVLGARHEFEASRRLGARGVATPGVAAFGVRGVNPARRRSFTLSEALDGFASLEDVGLGWRVAPPDVALKRAVLAAAGRLTAAIHAAGVCHRDYYACHLMAHADKLGQGEAELAVIDLHRAQVHRRLSRRARVRDLGALLYSTSAMPLTDRDRLRFVAAYTGAYTGRSGSRALRRRGFWQAVMRRAERLRARADAKGVATGEAARAGSGIASVGRLADLGRDPPLPFRFDAALGGDAVRALCTVVLRAQPGRRLVLGAVVNGRDVVLKAFFGPRADRDWKREQRGLKAVREAGLATPELLGTGRGGGARLLAFEARGDAREPSFDDIEALVRTLAGMHRRGIRQRDLHPGNFLVCGSRVLLVDGASVTARKTLRSAERLSDIARLLAHYPSETLGPLTRLATAYEAEAGATLPKRATRQLDDRVARARRRRLARFVAKTWRECTAFAVRVEPDRRVVLARGEDDPQLMAIVADPEGAVSEGMPLKHGNTAKAVRCGDFVVKRYNVKSRWHLRRLMLRKSRARRAWRAGHGLMFAGLSTPRPRALIETMRPGVGEAAAFLVVDHVEGARLDEVAQGTGVDSGLAAAIAGMFHAWREFRFVHGDTKASNFVVKDGRITVLDLDAAAFVRRGLGFTRRHRGDRDRFLANWDDVPAPLRQVLGERA